MSEHVFFQPPALRFNFMSSWLLSSAMPLSTCVGQLPAWLITLAQECIVRPWSSGWSEKIFHDISKPLPCVSPNSLPPLSKQLEAMGLQLCMYLVKIWQVACCSLQLLIGCIWVEQLNIFQKTWVCPTGGPLPQIQQLSNHQIPRESCERLGVQEIPD